MWVHVCFYTHFLSTLYLCQKKIKVLQTQYLSKFAALSTHTFCPITPKFDKEPFLWLNSKYNKKLHGNHTQQAERSVMEFYYLIITGTADTAFTDTGGIVIGID